MGKQTITNKQAKSLLAIALTLWGFSTIVDKYILDLVPMGVYAGVKYLIAAVIFLIINPPKLKNGLSPHFKELVFKSALSSVQLTLLFTGITMITGFNVAMVLALGPIILFASSIKLLHEKFRLRVLSGLIVAVSGVLIMIIATGGSDESSNIILGNALILGALIFDVLTTLLSKIILSENVSPDTLAGFNLSWNAIYFLIIAIWQTNSNTISDIESSTWALIIISGVLFTLVPWVLFYRAFKHIDVEEVSVFVYLGPVAGIIASVVILDEQFTLPVLIGGSLVMLGLWMSQHKAIHFKPHLHIPHHINLRNGNGS